MLSARRNSGYKPTYIQTNGIGGITIGKSFKNEYLYH